MYWHVFLLFATLRKDAAKHLVEQRGGNNYQASVRAWKNHLAGGRSGVGKSLVEECVDLKSAKGACALESGLECVRWEVGGVWIQRLRNA